MKNIILVFSFLVLLFSCEIEKQKPPLEQISKEKKYHKLSIEVDRLPSNIYFYEPFLLLDYAEYKRDRYKLDTITKKETYEWDSLITGNYIFKTLSYKEEIFPFSVSKDTSIKIKNNINVKFINKFDKKELLEADTIEILYRQAHCFSNYFEKSILVKDKIDNSYFISAHFNNYKSLKQHKASSNIINNLFLVQNQLLKSDNNGGSTSTETLQILANGRIYSNTKTHAGWHIYGEFKKKYITIE